MLFRWEDHEPFLNTFARGPAFEDLRRRVERAFDTHELDRDAAPTRAAGPHIADKGDALELTADLPGVADGEVSLSLNQDVLTLSVKRVVTPPDGYRPHRQERSAFQATRSFALPTRIDPERVRARLVDGVLTVTLAKAPESQPRKVTVSVN